MITYFICDGETVWAELGFIMMLGGKWWICVKNHSGHRSDALPKYLVVQFQALDEHVVFFVPGILNTLSIPTIKSE